MLTFASPKVAILLCTYQGQPYIAEQLDSFFRQTYSEWKVWASDDGSKDKTLSILGAYKDSWGEEKISVCTGPQKGFVSNFLTLICDDSIQADFYACSDQDDVWKEDKLERALTWLKSIPQEVPALYCSRTQLVDRDKRHMGYSPLFRKPPSFSNALVQSIAGGNTMVFNRAARKLFQEAGSDVDVVAHDWWLYMVVSGCGGTVFYDAHPSIMYRQHEDNLIGMNETWKACLDRIVLLCEGRFKSWNDKNLYALKRLKHRIAPENKIVLDCFFEARKRSLFFRLIGLRRSGIYRQTILGNLGVVFAALFDKV